MFLLQLVIFIAAAVLLIIKHNRRPPNFPPGLPKVPILGSLPFMKSDLFQIIRENTRKHGKIFSFFLGDIPMVVVSDFELFREAMSDDSFVNRADPGGAQREFFRPDKNGELRGIMFANDHTWVEQRRFSHRHMKDLGMGKSGMEPMIMEEAQKLIATFSKRIGKVTSLKLQLNVSILNAMWHIMTGEILEYDDPRCKEIIEKFYIMMARSNAVTPLLMWPWLRYIIPKQSGYTNTKEATERVTELIEESYDWHLKTFDTNNMRDFTDIYINEMMIHKDDANSTFNREDGKHNYIVVMTNMFVAGSETTSNTINYTLWYLCKYPEVQKKLQEEIDTVVGKDRVPTMNDKASLPYMEAVVHETQRIVGLAYNGIPRVAKRHVKLGGYDLPKGTRLGTALYEIMHDPTYWKDPEVYLPERFLKDGKFQPDERFVAFGIGKRNCMGKTLAQIELLLFLSAFIQRFNFRFPAGYDPATFKDEVGFILTCPDYPIIIDER